LSRIRTLSHGAWADPPSRRSVDEALPALEQGDVLFFPQLPFAIDRADAGIFSPDILSSSKNTSFDPATGRLGGTTLTGASAERLRAVMTRFSDAAATLVGALFPHYGTQIQRARASFRPAEIAGRETTWRKDDTRLHVDSFPATPVQGRRILRVFTNVNPAGTPRQWRVGGDFAAVAGRFADQLSVPWPGSGWLLQTLHVTKSRRTAYDALMLQLHDCMKADAAFQSSTEQETFAFPAGTTWIAFTDQVAHAATSGQYQLEQTFLVPVAAMRDERRSPLRILEGLKGRRLI
jgi:hypothetical protein